VKCYNGNPCTCGPFYDRVFYQKTFPSPVTRFVNPVETLVSASSIPGVVTVSATLVVRLRSVNTGPSSRAYLSLHSLDAPHGIDLSRLLFTCINVNQAATCTCNTRPRVSPHHVVNHSSQPRATIHQSSDAPVLNLPFDECIDNTHK
jgi:hypothetical protein